MHRSVIRFPRTRDRLKRRGKTKKNEAIQSPFVEFVADKVVCPRVTFAPVEVFVVSRQKVEIPRCSICLRGTSSCRVYLATYSHRPAVICGMRNCKCKGTRIDVDEHT